MLVLVASMTIKAGQEQSFEATMTAAVPQVRAEPGNHCYIFNRSTEQPRSYLFYEQYDDRAALDAHMAHLKQMGIDLASFAEGQITTRFFDLVA